MEEIKNCICLNYNEKKLSLCLFYYNNMNALEKLYFWNCIYRRIDKDIAIVVLSFLIDLQESPISFPKYAQKTLNFHIHQVNKRIAKLLPRKYAQYIKYLKLFKFAREDSSIPEAEQKAFDPYNYLVGAVYDLLVKTSTLEIVNSVNNYFCDREKEIDPHLTKHMLSFLQNVDQDNLHQCLKYISYNIRDPVEILEYLNDSHVYGDLIVQSIFVYNESVYNSMLNLIYENKKYYKLEIIKSLVEFDVTKFSFNDANIDIIKHIIIERPIYLINTINVLCLNISRETVLLMYTEHYKIFKSFTNDFNFSFEELLEISKTIKDLLYTTYGTAKDYEQKKKVYSLVVQQDDDFILDFIQRFIDSDLILFIITGKHLKGELKEYIISHYSHDEKYLYKLFLYFDKNKVIGYIDDYLVNKETLEYFLLVLKPTDILIHGHNMKNIQKSMKIIDICFESKSFNENDFIFTLNSIEQNLPPLIIRTLIITYKRYPHLKNFVISFLFRLINHYDILNVENLKLGVIKCLECLGSSSVDIIASLPENQIIYILNKSRVLVTICNDNIYKKENKYKREIGVLRNIIRNKY